MDFIIDNVTVSSALDGFNETDAAKYVDYVKKRASDPVKSIVVKLCDDGKFDVDYTLQGEKFERIRRITGYLVGSIDRWNNAKRSEERERVKHVL